MENFKAGHLGKKHINCFVRRVGIRKKKIKTIKKKLEFPPKDSNYRYSNFKFQWHTVEL